MWFKKTTLLPIQCIRKPVHQYIINVLNKIKYDINKNELLCILLYLFVLVSGC